MKESDSSSRSLPVAEAGGRCAPTVSNANEAELHDSLRKLLSRYNVNDYAASVKVFAIKPGPVE
jgi:hypothetical protein